MNRGVGSQTAVHRLARRCAAIFARQRWMVATCIAVVLGIQGEQALSQSSIRLTVSAVVPPPLCQYPEPCAASDPRFVTRAIIANDRIQYIGARPQVVKTDEFLIVLF